MTKTITILGDGQMGLVAAAMLANPDGTGSTPAHSLDLRLWAHEDGTARRLAQTRQSVRLPGLVLGESITVTGSDALALSETDLVVLAVPTQFIRPILNRLKSDVAQGVPVVSVSKGVEIGTLLRPTEIIADVLGDRSTGVLAGPTIATELARCLPATMVCASEKPEFALEVQELFTTSWMRIYTSDDPLGVELAGATKNVIAIAAGIIDGLQAGFNAKSALLARGLAEIARLGSAMGANPETFFGLTGVGDLATTCFSPEGRNRSCGEALGRGEAIDDYLARTDSVVEGVFTAKSVLAMAEKHDVDMPIVRAVNAILGGGLDPIDAITTLMKRDLKAERVG
ncbi:MAG: NAD(P)H-dependent glycerol-3-phosphate dehydrogenase [Planctomycetota bacterium]